jgi:hypothetical protein
VGGDDEEVPGPGEPRWSRRVLGAGIILLAVVPPLERLAGLLTGGRPGWNWVATLVYTPAVVYVGILFWNHNPRGWTGRRTDWVLIRALATFFGGLGAYAVFDLARRLAQL